MGFGVAELSPSKKGWSESEKKEISSAKKMDLLKRGLKSAAMDVVPQGLLNSFKVNSMWKKDEVIALVDLEASVTHLAIVKNAKLEFSREIPFGSHTTIQGLKERMSLSDLESAQEMRESYGILDEDSDKKNEKSPHKATEKGKGRIKEEKEKAFKVSQITKTELEKLVRDLRLSFNCYRAQCLEDRIDRIVLSGSGSL